MNRAERRASRSGTTTLSLTEDTGDVMAFLMGVTNAVMDQEPALRDNPEIVGQTLGELIADSNRTGRPLDAETMTADALAAIRGRQRPN